MRSVEIRGVTYTASALDTFAQLHIARKLSPSIPIVEGLIDPANSDKNKDILTVLMLSHIPDADSEYVVRKCMSVVTRRSGNEKATRIQAPDGSMMFDDITLADMLELTVLVIEENLGDFFRTALDSMAAVREQQG